jgi:hypothetical protein
VIPVGAPGFEPGTSSPPEQFDGLGRVGERCSKVAVSRENRGRALAFPASLL